VADNIVTLTGNLVRSPELRFTPSGQATATFGIAVNRTWTDRQTNEKKEQVSFFDVVAWGSLAENVATSLDKGMRVLVTGRLDQRTWENAEGEKRSKVEITADAIGPDLRWSTVTVTRNERTDRVGSAPSTGHGAPQAAVNPANLPQGYGLGGDDSEPF
jgi:single-strand DNA-binding protein